MLGTLLSLGIGGAVDHVLGKAVSTAGMKIGEKLVTKVGVSAISLAVGSKIDEMIEDAKPAVQKAIDDLCGVEIIEPNEEEAE